MISDVLNAWSWLESASAAVFTAGLPGYGFVERARKPADLHIEPGDLSCESYASAPVSVSSSPAQAAVYTGWRRLNPSQKVPGDAYGTPGPGDIYFSH